HSSGRAIRTAEEAKRLGAAVCTDRFDEVVAALKRDLVAEAARNALSSEQASRLREFLAATTGLPSPASLLSGTSLDWQPVWRIEGSLRRIGQTAMRIIETVAKTGYCQLFRVQGDQISLVASRMLSGAQSYELASWDGIIGRAARTGLTVHVPDVTEEPTYI